MLETLLLNDGAADRAGLFLIVSYFRWKIEEEEEEEDHNREWE